MPGRQLLHKGLVFDLGDQLGDKLLRSIEVAAAGIAADRQGALFVGRQVAGAEQITECLAAQLGFRRLVLAAFVRCKSGGRIGALFFLEFQLAVDFLPEFSGLFQKRIALARFILVHFPLVGFGLLNEGAAFGNEAIPLFQHFSQSHLVLLRNCRPDVAFLGFMKLP